MNRYRLQLLRMYLYDVELQGLCNVELIKHETMVMSKQVKQNYIFERNESHDIDITFNQDVKYFAQEYADMS